MRHSPAGGLRTFSFDAQPSTGRLPVRISVNITGAMVTLLVGATLFWGTLGSLIKLVIFLAAIYGVSVVVRLPTVRS